MSLMLRKKCQSLLDNVNLDDYHIRVDGNNNMTIVGPCGKPLFTISGIKFARTAPSKDEINYAHDLLKEFLVAHKTLITKYFAAKATLDQNPPAPPHNSIKISRMYEKHPNTHIAKGYIITIDNSDTNEKLTKYTYQEKIDYEHKGDIKDTGKLVKNKTLNKLAEQMTTLTAAHDNASDAIKEIKSEIQTCTI